MSAIQLLGIAVAAIAVSNLIVWMRVLRLRTYDGPTRQEHQEAVAVLQRALAEQAAAMAVIKANRAEGPS